MTCACGSRPESKPTNRARTARILWTPEERRRLRRIIEERLVHGWSYQFEQQASALVVKPAWRLKPTERQKYVEAEDFLCDEARLAADSLTWFRRFLAPLANAPRGSRLREKYETFLLWLNCRANRAGHPSFNSIWEERAGGDVKLARKLKRKAYRRVERAIRIIKLGLFLAGETPEPLPKSIRSRQRV